MALERQRTFKTNVNNYIDEIVESFLHENPIDPALVQVYIDNEEGCKYITLTYGNREDLKKAYDKVGKPPYTEADEVNYCHIKDLKVLPNENLDDVVNEFVADDNISVLSINRYRTRINQGAIIFFVNLAEQKVKKEQKAQEFAKTQEELSQKLAQTAVKDFDTTQNETTDKYAKMLEETNVPQDQPTTEEHNTVEEPKQTKNVFNIKSKKKNKEV